MTEKKSSTVSERVQKLRDKRRAAGLIKLEIWTRPEHREQIKEYADQLNK